jgi:chemotaxis signal transduction protein
MKALVIRIDDAKYLLDIDKIDRIIPQDEITTIPDSSAYIEGIIDYAGEALKIVSFRKLLGQVTLANATREHLDQIKQSHVEWINSLEDAVNHAEPFTKVKDPTQCALGKVITEYSNCLKCGNEFRDRIDSNIKECHDEFHGYADKVLQEAERDKEAALKMIDDEVRTRYEKILKEIDYLEEHTELINSSTQRIIISKHNDQFFGLLVDGIDKIVEFDESKFSVVKANAHINPNIIINKSIIINDEIILYLEFQDSFLS